VRSAPLPAATQPAERGDLDAIMRDIRAAAASGSAVRTPAPVRLAQVQPRPTPTPTPKPTPVSAKAKQVADAAEPKKGKEQAQADLCKPAPKTAVRKGRASAAKEECAKPVSKDVKQAALKKKAEPKNSARVWVQVAGGANIGALPKEWAAVTSKASELKGKGPWTARNRGTNRLLAGPFKSEDEAQAAVARLRKVGIGAFRWASDDGEAVEKIGGK
jgi:hypothetical protein